MREEITVEQKFAKLMLALRSLRPFYSAVYEVMEKQETEAIDTAGVTTNQLLYNKRFVQNTDFDELVFIMVHEIAHIALKHVARLENRDPKIWNVACDMYINKALAHEFDLEPGSKRTFNGVKIAMPSDGIYCPSIDVDKDYAEIIYDDLMKQAAQNGYKQTGTGVFTYNGSGFSYNKANPPGDKPGQIKIQISGNTKIDIINTGEDQSEKEQKADKIVTDAVVRVEMSGNSFGSEKGCIEQVVKMQLDSYIDWRKLLHRYLIRSNNTDSSFSKPDKRMYYTRAIYPGQVPGEKTTLKNVKICIDTSASISDEDISSFCGQAYRLMKQYKTTAELVYWDTSATSGGEVTDAREMQRVSIKGRGGTDPSVLFNYFDSSECKVKPSVILVFTDGIFSTSRITAKQAKRYKDTIWIMTRDHSTEFKPPFGKLAEVKY